MTEINEELSKLIAGVKGKRPRAVLDHIIEHGFITTEELKERYGYNHPPRAARDVREEGIPLETYRVVGTDGRSIAAYRLGNPEEATAAKAGGRRAFPKAFKKQVVLKYGEGCALCGAALPSRALQVDHRVPYEVAGDGGPLSVVDVMLLCNSCNRAKSWSCESCPNWLQARSADACRTCYWGNPESYSHVATIGIRRLALVWQSEEVPDFDEIRNIATELGLSLSEYAKQLLSGKR